MIKLWDVNVLKDPQPKKTIGTVWQGDASKHYYLILSDVSALNANTGEITPIEFLTHLTHIGHLKSITLNVSN